MWKVRVWYASCIQSFTGLPKTGATNQIAQMIINAFFNTDAHSLSLMNIVNDIKSEASLLGYANVKDEQLQVVENRQRCICCAANWFWKKPLFCFAARHI